MGGAAGAIEGDDDGEADCDFGGGDRDDEEDQDLRIVIGETIVAEAKTGKRYERKIGRIEHQLQGHENDDDVAPEQHTAEADGKQNSANGEIVAQGSHRRWRLDRESV